MRIVVRYKDQDVYPVNKENTADSINSSNTKRSLKACHDVL